MTRACVTAGSLYAMVLTDTKALGAITPIGGVLLIAGSVCLKIYVGRMGFGVRKDTELPAPSEHGTALPCAMACPCLKRAEQL